MIQNNLIGSRFILFLCSGINHVNVNKKEIQLQVTQFFLKVNYKQKSNTFNMFKHENIVKDTKRKLTRQIKKLQKLVRVCVYVRVSVFYFFVCVMIIECILQETIETKSIPQSILTTNIPFRVYVTDRQSHDLNMLSQGT